ncbi:recombination protein RecT [Collimonas sp. PA-H2]|uniref:recombinase RecT n=1 Tax=Collimonas sp. PA-H2 TaxID=1881062 RepID=UPI000BF8EFC4|nr:recombinase RecT [Collimonas sp. PA-H2]PFH08127.1 recombination protein RecT [Collimonas sp. PA-H2]
MSNQLAVSPAKTLNDFMDKYKGQLSLALPKHISADRMIRLALTAFSQSSDLQKCDMHSIYASVVIAAQLGLEIGVGGQGYLVPYWKKTGYKAQFIPGWQGLVDLVSRAGRATVWTGAVYEGDKFDWALGDNPFVKHQPESDADHWKQITHVYAIGRVNGSQYPVIEVWSMNRVVRHLNKYNKVGPKHYAIKDDGSNMEMYARKVVLLQVLKYMPKSIEVMRAMDVANAVDSGKNFTFDGEVVVINDPEDDESANEQPQNIERTAQVAQPQSKTEKAAAEQQLQAAENTGGTTATASPKYESILGEADTTPLTTAEFEYLSAKMEAAALGSADVLKKFGIKLNEITRANFDAVIAWTKNPAV